MARLTSTHSRAAVLGLAAAAVLVACRRPGSEGSPSSKTKTAVHASSSAGTLVGAGPKLVSSAAPSAAASARPLAPAQAHIEGRRVVALDDAAKRKADAYLKALAGGRKATLAKAFARAEELFTTCLELSPGDARALAERGYARLLAGKLPEADADFAAAAEHAPSSIVLQQILHNRMLVARQRGDTAKAEAWAAAEQRQKAARRIAPGVDCTFTVTPISVQSGRPPSLADAWKRMVAAHVEDARAANQVVAPKANELVLMGAPVPANASELELWQRMTDGPRRDGGWVVTSESADGMTSGHHVLFARGGELFLQTNQALEWSGRCSTSGGTVEVAGGGTVPWHATVVDSQAYEALMCEWPDGKQASCASRPGEGTPVMSYCTWSSRSEKLVVFDAQSFEAVISIEALAQPRDEKQAEPAPLITADFQPTKAVVRMCGTTQEVPYDLGAKAGPGAAP